MNAKQVSGKKNKPLGRFLLGQILLCVLIITSMDTCASVTRMLEVIGMNPE